MASSGSEFEDFLVDPHKCNATGKGLQGEVKLGESVSAILHVVDIVGEPYTKPVESLTCELMSESTGEKMVCSVGKTEANGEYEISYKPISRGWHQLHIKVKGKHIKESPFTVFVVNRYRLDTANYAIIGEQIDSGESGYKLKWPNGVAVNSRGDIIVVEQGAHCVSIFDPEGEKVFPSFGSFGSRIGEFNEPRGVAVDEEDNILVVDSWNHRIQKFKSGGKFIKTSEEIFQHPAGIAIHPSSKRIYVADNNNYCVTILNPDLTLFDCFGRGRFRNPYDLAFDSTGTRVYVVDQNSHQIQIFTAEGKYLMQFGSHGSGDGKLNGPNGICIDGENVVYVTEWHNNRISLFSCQHVGDGIVPQFLKSFGTLGNKQGQFKSPCGIALNLPKTHTYVADLANNRIQIFDLKDIR
jgi:DNA-binding beta-propeller fold protein YncE